MLPVLADKYAVRQYVKERIGSEYLIPLYLVTDSPADIKFSMLPTSFVVKATHGSGWNMIISDKSTINVSEAAVQQQCADWLVRNHSQKGREWHYRFIPPRIVVEKFIGENDGKVPFDYKFFCFDGQARFIQVDADRFDKHTRNIYDLAWNRLEVRYFYDNFQYNLSVPTRLTDMIAIANELAKGLDFVRVDLYSVDDQIYFGEMTHHPENGFGKFSPEYLDMSFGANWPMKV